jgi:hypothetical protein
VLVEGGPVVEVLYTCESLVLWDDGVPGFGGYYARIAGFGEQGEGRTIDQALERLASELRDHVENWDAEVDEYAHARRSHDRINRVEEPELVTWAREALRSAQVLEGLRDAMQPPVLEDQ